MAYCDKKNPWHVVFDKYKEDHPEQVNDIKVFHPTIFPIIDIEFKDGSHVLYHGRTSSFRPLDPDKFNETFWALYIEDPI